MTKLAFEATQKWVDDWYTNFSTFVIRQNSVLRSVMENNFCGFYSVKSFWGPFNSVLSCFEIRNEEVCNKDCSYRPTNWEQIHILNQNIKIARI